MHFDWMHIALLGLVLATLWGADRWLQLSGRHGSDWVLDSLSLANHFLVIPALQVVLSYPLYRALLPGLQGTLSGGWITALGLNLAIDYAWYWNHRAMHARTFFWNLHAVHHEPRELDVLASARNSIGSPMFMVYFWLTPLAIHLSQDPKPFLFIAGLGLFVNFWGHTRFNLPRDSWWRRALSLAIIQPEDHFWHHSQENSYCNFGTVFNFWDRIHGTWHQPNRSPASLGFDLQMPLWRKVLFPF